ncbi:filamentous hemagglutinin family outer membrane protein [Gloeothece citriformis PCC 7424]|uniref:Filamentous hemagglutinin family outer membrane protein n=2 Tax=Gloeothece TaxID=28070 RepID=B7KJS0_GLOC7|nr:filamentous hemagglutinin family outer membrane protein [Gloeothece citriformis PCC 7424]
MRITLTGLLAVGVGLMLNQPMQGQSITPANDGTGTIINRQGNQYNIEGGTLSEDGRNLFHSLEKFGLTQAEIANFLSNPQIRNILTRIVGGNPSVINGLIQVLNGNSNLYIMNPAGIIFGPNARINVPADFVVTTATRIGFDNNLWFNAFESNDYAQLMGNPSQFAFDLAKSGTITNLGNLTVTEGHHLMLLGKTVNNSGTLNAPEGNITIAAVAGTNRIKISQENNLVSLEIERPDTNVNSNLSALDLPTLLTEGKVSNSASISPLQPGTVIISGNLSVSNAANSPLQQGGQVNIIGDQISLINANINATGTRGGGIVQIGANSQGQDITTTASRIAINGNSSIDVSAIDTGEGGQVIISGNTYTNVVGQIRSRGGQEEGNGGYIKIVGVNGLDFQGTVDTSALQGDFGVLVLNSNNLTIENSQGFSSPKIRPSSLNTLSSNLILEASNKITFNDPINLQNSPSGLTVIADKTIQVNDNINTQKGSIILQANETININNSQVTTQDGSIILEPILPDLNSLLISLDNSFIETVNPTENIRLTAQEIDLNGSTEILGQNQLEIKPPTDDKNIILGGDNNNPSALNLTGSELEKINGFESVIIGNNNGLGRIEIGNDTTEVNLNNQDYNLILQGKDIKFNNSLILADDKTLTLNTQTVTSANSPPFRDIKIEGEQGQLILNTSGSVGTLDNPLDTEVSYLTISSTLGDNFIYNHSDISLGKISIADNLDLNVDGNIRDNDRVVIGGILTLRGQDIILDNNNDLNTVAVTEAENLTLNDTNELDLANLQINNDLNLTTNGDITHSGSIQVLGITNLNTNGNDIILNSSNTDLNIVNIFNSKNVFLKDINDIILNNPLTANSLTIEATGNITTNDINTSSTLISGGNVNLISDNGKITTGGINTSSPINNAGNVTLKAQGDIETAYINAQGISNTIGGDVAIITNNFIRITDFFIDSNNTLASISTVGENGGGNIIIQHGGQGITQFKIGDPTVNGTSQAITTGSSTINNESLSYTTTRGNIQLISVNELSPEPSPEPSPSPNPNPNPIININPEPNPNPNPITNINPEPNPTPNPNTNINPEPNPNPNPNTNINPEPNPNPNPITNINPDPNPNPITHINPEPNPNPNPITNINFNPNPNPITNTNSDIPVDTKIDPIFTNSIENLSTIEEIDPIRQSLFVDTNQPSLSLQSNRDIVGIVPTGFLSIFGGTATAEVGNVESNFTDAFENYLGINKASTLSLKEKQIILNNIEEKSGYKSAFVYIYFKPNSTTTAQEKQEQQEILWRYRGGKPSSQKNLASEGQGTDQLEIIVITSTGDVIQEKIEGITRDQVMSVVKKFQQTVTNPRRPTAYLQPSQQLYQWFIASIEQDLQAQNIDTLVFILDAGLRSVPMAALNDGQQFLIEKYSMGLMPSVALTDTRYVNVQNSQVLAMGASTFRDQNPLPSVPIELSLITDQLWQGRSYINESFTLNNLKKAHQSEQFRIVHLATHANFEGGTLANSYIQLWDNKLTMEQLKGLGLDRPPIDLLVLSACRTALGNRESELGFAGAAVLANVKTVLGSLWEVSDEGTLALMTSFYQQLRGVPLKAEALRKAQLSLLRGDVKMIQENSKQAELLIENQRLPLPPQLAELGAKEFTHPYYWSSFTVIGNPW